MGGINFTHTIESNSSRFKIISYRFPLEESSQVAMLRKRDSTVRNSICRQVAIEYVRHRCFHDFTVTYFERMSIDSLV